jgi:hypothetical protein
LSVRFYGARSVAGVIGLSMGTAVVYVEFTLGAGFGNFIADETAADWHAKQFLMYAFGLGTMIPTATLVGVPTQDKLISLFRPKGKQKTERKNQHPHLKKGVQIFGHFTVSLTGAPFAYILVEAFPDNLPVQIFWAALTFITSYLCASNSVLVQIEKLFNHYDEDRSEIQRLQNKLLNKLQNILVILYNTSEEEIAKLFSVLSNDPSEYFLQELKKLSDVAATEHSAFQTGMGKTVLDGLALLTGTAATYALYALTETASEWVLSGLGLDDDTAKKGVANTIALISTIPNTLFLADFTKRKCDDFYYRYNDKNYKPITQTSRAKLRKCLNWSSFFIGCLAAIGNTYLAIENADPKALTVFVPLSFLGSSFAQATAMNMLLQRAVDYYDLSRCPNAAFTQRDLLIKVINIFSEEIITKLDLKDLSLLDKYFSQDVETTPHNTGQELIESKESTERNMPTQYVLANASRLNLFTPNTGNKTIKTQANLPETPRLGIL